jgi:hypothetical protein
LNNKNAALGQHFSWGKLGGDLNVTKHSDEFIHG